MSGHGTEAYANENELRKALPAGTDLVYADTREMPARSWQGLFHTGRFQVQITDPQSVDGGLPFRVFECAACAVPLLSDHRPELAEIFPGNLSVALASSEAGLAEETARLMATPARELRAQGRAQHQRFLTDHTWEARWNEIARNPSPRTAINPLSNVLWKPSGHEAEPLAHVT
jgi:spore maturation protein CgeB